VDEEVRRLLREAAEDDTLPPSPVSDEELLDKFQTAGAAKAPPLRALWRWIRSLAQRAS
jgi:hypothetical protein